MIVQSTKTVMSLGFENSYVTKRAGSNRTWTTTRNFGMTREEAPGCNHRTFTELSKRKVVPIEWE